MSVVTREEHIAVIANSKRFFCTPEMIASEVERSFHDFYKEKWLVKNRVDRGPYCFARGNQLFDLNTRKAFFKLCSLDCPKPMLSPTVRS